MNKDQDQFELQPAVAAEGQSESLVAQLKKEIR